MMPTQHSDAPWCMKYYIMHRRAAGKQRVVAARPREGGIAEGAKRLGGVLRRSWPA